MIHFLSGVVSALAADDWSITRSQAGVSTNRRVKRGPRADVTRASWSWAGHFAFEDEPRRTADEVAGFLAAHAD